MLLNEVSMKNIIVNGNFSENEIVSSKIEALGNNQIKFWKKSSGNIVIFGNSFYCNNLNIVFKGSNNKLIIGDNVKFTGHILIVGSNRTVQIGNDTTAQGVYILSRDADVTIGNNCMFSREIEIRSTDVHKIYDLATGDRLNLARDINIGNNVWIAARAIISKGAIIPDGCVIGASSFVNKAFNIQNCIIAGIPAKIIKENIRWER